MRIFSKQSLLGLAGSLLILGAGIAGLPLPASANSAGAGFAGKVVSVTGETSFQAEVRVVYAGAGTTGIGAILPAGRVVTIRVPAGTSLVDVRGRPILLSQVQPGTLFNATVIVNLDTKEVTANTIIFGSKLLLPANRPPADTTPPASISPAPTTSSSTVPPSSGGTAVAGFSGKVVSITSDSAFQAEVRLVYAGGTTRGVAGVLPPGKVVTIHVPAGTQLVNARNQPITLSQVQAGALFNATVRIDTVSKTITASKIIFVSVSGTAPAASSSTTPNSSETSGASAIGAPSSQTATVNFAGKFVSIDASARTAQVIVRGVYGGVSGVARFGFVVPPGTKIRIIIPEGVAITRMGMGIPLSDVLPGDLFNAKATIDRVAKTGVAASIQVITPRLSEVAFAGIITVASDSAITLKSQAGIEQTFTIVSTTKIFLGRTPGTTADLTVGKSAVITFITTQGVKQAVKIVVATSENQAKIDRFKEKYLTVDAIEKRGAEAAKLIAATLTRFDQIITKQEAQISSLKTAGKDTTKADASLAASKTDSAAAHASLDATNVLFAAIETSTDPKTATAAARESLKKTISATKKVFVDIKNTQVEIKALLQ